MRNIFNCGAFVLIIFMVVACKPVRNGPVAADEASIARAKHIDLIEAAMEIGDFDGVREAIQAARQDGVDHPRMPHYEAVLLLHTGVEADTEAALPLLAQAVSGSPNWVEPRLLMADAYLRINRLAAAASVYEEFDRLFPEHPHGPYGKGYIAVLQGQNEEAAGYLSEALKRDPNHTPALGARVALARAMGDNETERRMLERYLAQRPRDPVAWENLGARYVASGRNEDARRAFERSYAIAPRPDLARRLADLARAQGDAAAAAQWNQRAQP